MKTIIYNDDHLDKKDINKVNGFLFIDTFFILKNFFI